MSLPHALLGLISYQPSTGYELRTTFQRVSPVLLECNPAADLSHPQPDGIPGVAYC